MFRIGMSNSIVIDILGFCSPKMVATVEGEPSIREAESTYRSTKCSSPSLGEYINCGT
jgi:hypothetical protein